MNSKIFDEIKNLISANDVVLFMKGTKTQPMCGFSGVIVQALNKLGVSFVAVNVLENNEMRQAIKEFSDWPTIPQLYIKEEFIGGSDIVQELYQSGELVNLLATHGISCGL